jgi:hypothetical protein
MVDKKALMLSSILFLVLMLCYSLNGLAGIQISGDVAPSMVMPWAILEYHTLYLDDFKDYFLEHFKSYYFTINNNGHLSSFYPIITPLIALPFYIPGYIFLTLNGGFSIASPYFDSVTLFSMRFASTTITALAVVIFFNAIRKLTNNDFWAYALSLALGITTELWSISSAILWQHGVSVLLISIMIYLIVSNQKKQIKHVFIYVIFCSLILFLNRPNDAPLALPMLYCAFKNTEITFKNAWYIVGCCGIVFGLILVWWIYSGLPLAGYTNVAQWFGTQGFLEKLFYQFFNLEHGLLLYTPIVILSLIGIYQALKKPELINFTLLTITSLIIFTVAIVCLAAYPGTCFGPRYYTETMPILFLFIGMIDKKLLGSKWFMLGFILLFVVSLVIQLYGVFIATY